MTENTKDSGYQIETLKAEKVALYEEVRKYRDENEALKKQKEYLQRQCRKAGRAILSLETDKISLNKDIERIQEEYENYKIIKGNHD